MNVRKVSGSIAVCVTLFGLHGISSELQKPTELATRPLFTVNNSHSADFTYSGLVSNASTNMKSLGTDLNEMPKVLERKSVVGVPQKKSPPGRPKTAPLRKTKRTVTKQAIPDCNYFGGMQTCEISAIAEINPNSPNSVNPGGVVQGPGNLFDFKLGNKALSPGNLVGPLHGFFEVPTTWSITGWTTGTNWTCSGSAPVSGGAALPGSSFWGIYAGQADPPFNASQNNSVRCAYNGPKLAPGDVTATAVTFSVTVPASTTRWSSFFGASSEYLIGGQNGAVENNYQVINYMTLRYDINGGTGTTPSPELYNVVVANGNQTAASNSGFSKAGFTFGGWSCDNSIGTKQPGQSISWSNADVVCTAIWTPPAFQLSYNAGAGSGTVPSTVTGLNSGATPTLAAGSGITPPANQTFTGWNCDNSIGAKNAGATATMPAANVICTAQFTPNATYQLSYNAGAGSGTVPSTVTGLNPADTPTLAAGSGVTPPANQTFTGWNCDNSIGAKNAGATATMPAANVICTAQFAPNATYQLSYNAGGGKGAVPASVSGLVPGTSTSLASGAGLKRSGFTFKGWNCDQSIGNKSARESATQPSANVVCTAKWSENSPQIVPASADVKEATNDSSIGKRGEEQILQPLGNDDLLNSSKWNLPSMRLCGPRQSAPKCALSSLDIKGEGTYAIDSKGRVIFTPEPDFVGEATSVKYQVTNNRGRVVAANINVTVLDQELPQSGSDSQTMLLLALLLIFIGAIQCSIQKYRHRSG